jgi:hypothetical protein
LLKDHHSTAQTNYTPKLHTGIQPFFNFIMQLTNFISILSLAITVVVAVPFPNDKSAVPAPPPKPVKPVKPVYQPVNSNQVVRLSTSQHFNMFKGSLYITELLLFWLTLLLLSQR